MMEPKGKMDVTKQSREIFRVDPMIECENLVSFCEMLARKQDSLSREPFSVIGLDVNQFAQVNATLGRTHGDAMIRWIGIVLMEEIHAPVYRLGGDSMGVLLTEGGHAQHAQIARSVFERLNAEAPRFGVTAPVATITVTHYPADAMIESADVWSHLYSTMYDAKANAESFKIYNGSELERANRFLKETLGRMVTQIASLGAMLDESQALAFTDPVTGLPNLRAALDHLDATLAHANAAGQSFAVLMIDGDNLTEYNDISYAFGDAMIGDIARTLKANLRPEDFLARWRSGDEFLIILPHVAAEQARAVSERFRACVEQASREWKFPVTISIGAAVYPRNGKTSNDLLMQAETGLKSAKDSGRNRVVMGM